MRVQTLRPLGRYAKTSRETLAMLSNLASKSKEKPKIQNKIPSKCLSSYFAPILLSFAMHKKHKMNDQMRSASLEVRKVKVK